MQNRRRSQPPRVTHPRSHSPDGYDSEEEQDQVPLPRRSNSIVHKRAPNPTLNRDPSIQFNPTGSYIQDGKSTAGKPQSGFLPAIGNKSKLINADNFESITDKANNPFRMP